MRIKKKLALLLTAAMLVTSVNVTPLTAFAADNPNGTAETPATGSTKLTLDLSANKGYEGRAASGSTKLTLVIADHEWEYFVGTGNDANKLTAKCNLSEHSSDDCHTTGVSLTLNASSANYSGSAATVGFGEGQEETWKEAFGEESVPSIKYYQEGGTVSTNTADNGAESESGAPKKTGKYVAKATYTVEVEGQDSQNYTISVPFEIKKHNFDLATSTMTGITLDDENLDINTCLSDVIGENSYAPSSGDIIVYAKGTDSNYKYALQASGWDSTDKQMSFDEIKANVVSGNTVHVIGTVQKPSNGGGGSGSGGGGYYPSTPSTSVESVIVPVKGEDTVNIEASVKDGNAEVKEITSADIDKINTNEATGTETTTITIDLSGAKQDVNSVTLTKTTVDTLAKATADTSNKVDSVEIKLSKATVTLDEKAIGAVNEQAKGDKVSIKVEDSKTTDLNTTQQTAIKDMNVIDSFEAHIESNGTQIHDFKGGNVNVTIAFVVPTGKKANHYFVYYVADNGKIEKFSTNVSNGKLTFTTTHFSDYVIVYDETMENDTDKPAEETPSTEDTSVDKADADKVVITAKQKAANKKALEKSFTVKASKSKVTVKWGKVKKADGYNVYASYDGKKYTKVKTIKNAKTTSYTIKKLAGKKINTKKKVKIYVVAYKTVDGSKKQFGKTKVLTTQKIK